MADGEQGGSSLLAGAGAVQALVQVQTVQYGACGVQVTDDLLGRNRGDTSPSQGEGLPAGIGQAGPQSPEAAPVPTDADDVSRCETCCSSASVSSAQQVPFFLPFLQQQKTATAAVVNA